MAASALAKSCGKNKTPFSYCCPTSSSAGISVSCTSANGSVFASSASAHCAAGSFKPFRMQYAMSSVSPPRLGRGAGLSSVRFANRSMYARLPMSRFFS